MNKKVFSTVMVCTVALSVIAPTAASADEFDNQIQNQQALIDSLESQQADAQSQINNLQSEVAEINAQAADLQNQQIELTQQAEELQNQITDLQNRIDKRQATIEAQAREAQINDNSTSFITAVLDADSLTDAVARVTAMTTLVSANNDLINQQKADKEVVEEKQAEVEAKQQEVNDTQAQLETQKGSLLNKQAELDVLTTTLAAQQATAEEDKAALEAQQAAAEQAAAELAAEQAAAQQAAAAEAAAVANTNETTEDSVISNESNGSVVAPSESNEPSEVVETPNESPAISEETPVVDQPVTEVTTPENNQTPASNPTNNASSAPAVSTPTASTSSSRSAIVSYAQTMLGIPYVWGGTTTSGFDCSGLTSYVYANAAGVSIGRVTTTQEYSGSVISVSEAQPGDLLFFGSRGSTYHVGIYLGNGQFIHAPKPGDVVKITNIAYYTPSFAVNVLG